MSTTQTVAERAIPPERLANDKGHRHLGLALVVIATAQLMVVLDATIVNVALPHIQNALGFSGSGLEWVVNAYAITFGGLLLLGGRSGDLLGRRRVFIIGLLLFSAASLFGGFATTQAWLLASRAAQGVGGAMIAPTALALITSTFAEGRERNRAMGVYAAMSGAGAAIGLIMGGLLTTYLSWRWVMFVNVPIGIATALLARYVLGESQRRRGRFDLPGAITVTSGVALLVYGLSNAGTDRLGVSHWGDTKVIVSLVAAVVLLASFVLIEWRSRHALLPGRVLADRSRTGSYVVMLALATAMFGIFFFLAIFVQDVLGYSALKSGVAFLPFAATMVVMSGISAQLIGRIGPRPFMIAGPVIASGGMFWFSRLTEHSNYVHGLLGPMMVTAAGLGMMFVPISLIALNRVSAQDSGVASSLLNTGQQIGGAIGLAALGTVTWTVVANSTKTQVAHLMAVAAAHGAAAGHAGAAARAGAGKAGGAVPPAIVNHALAVGISRGFLVAAGVVLIALVVVLATIRLRASDLTAGATEAVTGATGATAAAGEGLAAMAGRQS